MDFFGAIISGLLTTVSYAVIFFGIYKLYQIATDIREIKELVASARRAPSTPLPATPVGLSALAAGTKDLVGEDSAAVYAAHLLRAVNAERQTETVPHESR